MRADNYELAESAEAEGSGACDEATPTYSCRDGGCGAEDCGRCHPRLQAVITCADCGRARPGYRVWLCPTCGECICEDCWPIHACERGES